MKTVSLSGSLRENVGKKDAKKVRREGNIPCVIYGGKEQIHFVAKYQEFTKLVFSPEVFLVSIDVDGTTYQTILQEVQYHPVTDKVLHADFLEVTDEKPIIVGIPVHYKGDSPGVIAGGQMIKKMHRLRVKGLVKDIPDFIMVDISELIIGGSVKIRDMKVDNLSFLDPANAVIVRVKTARTATEIEGEEEEEEAEEGAEEGAETASDEGGATETPAES
ncbi:MAG: 50S ribosomal protein L25/general stress protein Ctc [Bacteroidales bacterium]|nr:50S ribosomal protein L25/general stress protein Ctc [Bacteroidales bacterium]